MSFLLRCLPLPEGDTPRGHPFGPSDPLGPPLHPAKFGGGGDVNRGPRVEPVGFALQFPFAVLSLDEDES